LVHPHPSYCSEHLEGNGPTEVHPRTYIKIMNVVELENFPSNVLVASSEGDYNIACLSRLMRHKNATESIDRDVHQG
jgi:hypothetical protein